MQTGYAAQTEYAIQAAVMDWARDPEHIKKYPELPMLFHVPNGGQRSKITGARLKRIGVKAGIPDLHLPVARNGYTGLWIELKKPGGTTSKQQKDVMAKLRFYGHLTVVCWSADGAIKTITGYLS